MTEANKAVFDKVLSMQDEVVRFAGSLCKDWQQAQDLAQDTLIRAYNYKNIHKIENVRAWVFKIVRNVWIDSVRKTARRPNHYPIAFDNGVSDGEYSKDFSMPAPSSDVAAYEANGANSDNYDMLFSDVIVKALKAIPEVYERAVILSDVEDHTYEEIAGKLNVPVGTVRSRIFRGRKLLRARISELKATT